MTVLSAWPGIDLVVAGHTIRHADRLVGRYCGRTGEQWAYAFYDCVAVEREGVTDLLTAAVMHGPLRREDLQWYVDRRGAMLDLVDQLPADVPLAEASSSTKDLLAGGVASLAGGDPRRAGLLTKVLHRHRPALVAIDERDVGRLLARQAGRGGRVGYRELLDELGQVLVDQRRAIEEVRALLAGALGEHPHPTPLRTLDIAIWMDARRSG